MTRVFLTGASGFIAAHILEVLLEHGHSVVGSVRSKEKAQKIFDAHKGVGKDKLDLVIVEDISKLDAFDEAIKSDPPFEAVIHAASPFHYNNITDVQKDFLDPAINGTTGILKAIKRSAPTVKHVVVTSSFAAILDGYKGNWPEHTYSEKDWNPITLKQASESEPNGYRASKTFAERAAWEFVEKEKPNFTLTTLCPPLVLGPIEHYLNSLDALNTSNQRVRDLIQGKMKSEISPTGVFVWIDVRDLALAHVLSIEKPEAAGKRFFVTAGYYSNREIADILRKNFPELKDKLPGPITPGGDYPKEGLYKIDNSQVQEVLGLKFTSLEKSIVDLAKSLQAVGA